VSSGGAGQRSRSNADKDRKCPICGKPADEKHFPFCSKRCAQVDLNRWLSGAYALPGAKQSGRGDGENSD
jgi:endogenous inhibitor of DNA gyrase (YacG/DUF329 family)